MNDRSVISLFVSDWTRNRWKTRFQIGKTADFLRRISSTTRILSNRTRHVDPGSDIFRQIFPRTFLLIGSSRRSKKTPRLRIKIRRSIQVSFLPPSFFSCYLIHKTHARRRTKKTKRKTMLGKEKRRRTRSLDFLALENMYVQAEEKRKQLVTSNWPFVQLCYKKSDLTILFPFLSSNLHEEDIFLTFKREITDGTMTRTVMGKSDDLQINQKKKTEKDIYRSSK